MKHSTPIHRRRWMIAAGTALASGAMVGINAIQHAAAAGLIPTTVSVSAAKATIAQGGSDTLTATVSPSLVVVGGISVAPSGSVSFSASNGASTVQLGSAPLGGCMTLGTCTASITTSGLPVGSDTVTATYGGDTLFAGKSASTTVTVLPTADQQHQAVTTCTSTGPCSTGVIYSDTLDAAMQVSSTGPTTLNAYMGGDSSLCSVPNSGSASNFTANPPPGNNTAKTIDYYVFDTAADNAQAARVNHAVQADSGGPVLPVHACYVADSTFKGFYPDPSDPTAKWGSDGYIVGNAAFGFVPQVHDSNGKLVYLGLLPQCVNNNDNSGNNAPCWNFETYSAPPADATIAAGHSSEMHLEIMTSANYPKVPGP